MIGSPLPDGTRVRAVIEGTLYGSLLRTGYGWNLNIRDCVSVEPVPVTPKPGRHYASVTPDRWPGTFWTWLGPDGEVWVTYLGDESFTGRWSTATAVKGWAGPLVECEPPAEFREGQK